MSCSAPGAARFSTTSVESDRSPTTPSIEYHATVFAEAATAATIESENNKTIAEVNRNDDAEEMKANAHLLNAAPKMYLFIELVSKVSHDPELRNHAQFLLREANGEKPEIRKGNQK